MNKTRVKLITVFFFGCLVTLLNASTGHAAPCTPGTDCYCDKVKQVGNAIYDPNLLICEDFEAPTLRLNQGVGNGAPYYGPWFDDSGQTGNRGANAYWTKKYGSAIANALLPLGQPVSPQFGTPCTYDLCNALRVWDRTDRWGGNNYTPVAAIMTQPSDFQAEDGTLSVPRNTAGGGSGVFDGNANWAHRIAPGAASGIVGEQRWAPIRTIGYTAAIAYASNSDTSGVWGGNGGAAASWKHNEWATVYTPNGGFDGLFIFYNQNGPLTGRPFAGFIGSFQDRNCNPAGITATLGVASCSTDKSILAWNTPANYNQPTDWPFGTWGCVRGLIENAGLVNTRMRVWFQGPAMTSERLIIDITLDGTVMDNKQGYNGMEWNAYSNTNAGTQYGYTPSTQLTFRYEDNVHVRTGPPVSCAQIGFVGAGGGGPTPNAPTGLKVF